MAAAVTFRLRVVGSRSMYNHMFLLMYSALAAMLLAAPGALAQPHALNDVRLGASYGNLTRQLDLRDGEEALLEAKAMSLSRPYFGKRGYGCMRRDDPGADITCVSHEEKVGGAETREIRLQFLDGLLQQFSVSAEMKYVEPVIAAVTRVAGQPAREGSGTNTTWRWQNSDSTITGYAGENLVYVVFSLVSYPEAVERKRKRGPNTIECR